MTELAQPGSSSAIVKSTSLLSSKHARVRPAQVARQWLLAWGAVERERLHAGPDAVPSEEIPGFPTNSSNCAGSPSDRPGILDIHSDVERVIGRGRAGLRYILLARYRDGWEWSRIVQYQFADGSLTEEMSDQHEPPPSYSACVTVRTSWAWREDVQARQLEAMGREWQATAEAATRILGWSAGRLIRSVEAAFEGDLARELGLSSVAAMYETRGVELAV